MLRIAIGGGRVSDFPENSGTKMYCSTFLSLRRGGWVSNFQKKTLHLNDPLFYPYVNGSDWCRHGS